MCQVVEQLGVVMHRLATLLYVHELLAFLFNHAYLNVVGVESVAELGPRHLVVCGASGSIVGPSRAGVTT
jgi:hypothetical protein